MKGQCYDDPRNILRSAHSVVRRILVVEYDVTYLPSEWPLQKMVAASGLRPPSSTRIEERRTE